MDPVKIRFERLQLAPLSIQGLFAECGLRAGRFVLNVIDHGAEEVDVRFSSRTPAKGDTVAILVTLPPARDLFQKLNLSFREMVWGSSLVSIEVDGSKHPIYPVPGNDNVWRALMPTTPLDVPGPCSFTVRVRDGRHKVHRGEFDIVDKDYPVESIWLSDAKSSIRGGTEKERMATTSLKQTKSPEQLWRGPFVNPTQGEVTTGFGVQRFYNGVFAEGYYHQGVDYGAEEGTPVQAPADGRVVLVGKEAEGFELHGNCVGLDHGQGVTTILMHLSTVSAVEGEMVKRGQVVGAVGESGLATGPHLHWGVYVNGKAVNPGQWLDKHWWL